MSSTNSARSATDLFKPHPILDLEFPPLSEMERALLSQTEEGIEAIAEHEEERQKRIAMADKDPLNHGFELPHWKDIRHLIDSKDEVFILGGNGSAKTHLGGKLVVEKLVKLHGMKVLCVARSDDDSKTYQQTAVYQHLPMAAREWNAQMKKRRGVVTKINYTVANGFTESTFVLPNRSQCWFKTLAQYERDPLSFEGPEYDLVWIDEGAVPGLVDSLRFRVSKRAGKLIFTFTAVHGYDTVCGSVLDGARVIKSLPMNWDWLKINEDGSRGGRNTGLAFPELKEHEVQVKGLPAGEMPFIVQPLDFNKGVVFAWTHWNPFLPKGKWNPKLPATFDKCVGRAKWQVRVRLFGYVEKMAGAAISNFNPNVHVIPHERIEKMLKAGKMTTYMAADPAGRTYFLLWAGVDELGRKYIIDESPTIDEGAWVGMNGEQGEGQTVYQGSGVKWYKKYIRERELEHGTEAYRRFGDPRYFATEVQSTDGATDLYKLFEREDEAGGDYTVDDVAPMIFEAAKIRQTVKDDVEVLVSMLAYDTNRDMDAENKPDLLVSDKCVNTIKAFINWNGKAKIEGGKDNPYKDPVDAARYAFGQELYYVDEKQNPISGGGGW